MKIISLERFDKNEVEYALKQDLLIPCYVYQIPIEISKNIELNIIEETVLKLIQVDDSLKDDSIRLSKLLGFYSENNAEDKTLIIKLILRRLKDLRIDTIKIDEEKTEVKIYQFYQEAYTHKLLPVITTVINDYSYPEKDRKYNKNSFREISFKKGIDSKRITKAILVNDYDKNNTPKPTKVDILETIYIHNQNKYKGSFVVDYKSFSIDLLQPELLHLHTRLYIPKNNIDSVVITNGFTNDFSIVLRKIYSNQYPELLSLLKKSIRVDTDKSQNNTIIIPFEIRINRYKEEKKLIEIIEAESLKVKQDNTTKEPLKRSKRRLNESLYDLIEMLLEKLSKDLPESNSLKDRKMLKGLAKDSGFEIRNDYELPIFKVHKNDNLQKYLAKSLLHKKDELKNIASNYPSFLSDLSKLFKLRNGFKHSNIEETLVKIDIDELDKYKKIAYNIVTIVLKVKPINIKQTNTDVDDDIFMQNAILDLENELNFDVFIKLPQEVKNNLINVNFFLNIQEFDSNKYNIVKEVINSLYSSFEFILRRVVNTLDIVNEDIPTKDDLLSKIREKNELKESLYRVSPKMIDSAFNKKNASLGAYMLVYLYYNNDVYTDFVSLIENVLSLRGHGSPTMVDVEKIKLQELKRIKENSFKYLEKLIEKI